MKYGLDCEIHLFGTKAIVVTISPYLNKLCSLISITIAQYKPDNTQDAFVYILIHVTVAYTHHCSSIEYFCFETIAVIWSIFINKNCQSSLVFISFHFIIKNAFISSEVVGYYQNDFENTKKAPMQQRQILLNIFILNILSVCVVYFSYKNQWIYLISWIATYRAFI